MNYEDIDQFFKDKCTTYKCPFCSKTEWVVMTGEDYNGALLHLGMRMESGENKQSRMGINNAIAYCENCGFVRLHAQPIIERWLKEKEKNNGK